MGKTDPPAPPQLKYPGMTSVERDLLRQQVQAGEQLGSYSKTLMGNAGEDRSKAYSVLSLLQNPPVLSAEMKQLAQSMGQQYFENARQGLTTGTNQDVFSQNRKDSIIQLLNSGTLNSTTGTDVLSRLYQNRSDQIAGFAGDAALQTMNQENQFINLETNKNLDIFRTLLGQQAYGSQVAGQLSGASMSGLANAGAQFRQDRADRFNIDAQNQQAMYNYKLSNFRNRRSAMGNIFGTVGLIGGTAAGFAMGNPLLGASLGGSIGSGIGGMF